MPSEKRNAALGFRAGAEGEVPPPGGSIEVLPGLHWARMPLPMRLNHVNVWLLEDGAGWALVDGGLDTPDIRAHFDTLFETALRGRKITRVIVTHAHPDHIGVAGSICRRFDATLHMTLAEWLFWRMRHLECRLGITPESRSWFVGHGVGSAAAAVMESEQEIYTERHRDPVPGSFHRVLDGDVLTIGGRRWTAITAGGHAAEHLSLYCAAERVLIAGDQILGRISPMIGVFAQQPEEDPLTQYLHSLGRFGALAADALVLPSHGIPFAGLGPRVAALAAHHAERLDTLLAAAAQPLPAIVLAARLFSAQVMAEVPRLALFETVAHLNCLVARGRLARRRRDDGVFVFERIPAP